MAEEGQQLSVRSLKKASERQAEAAAAEARALSSSAAVRTPPPRPPQSAPPPPPPPSAQQPPPPDQTQEVLAGRFLGEQEAHESGSLVWWIFIGGGGTLLLIIILSFVHMQMNTPGGPLWNRDKEWIAQRQMMRLCVSEMIAEPAAMAGRSNDDPFGPLTFGDPWGNTVYKLRGRFVSAGLDGIMHTQDDIWADFNDWTVGMTVTVDPEELLQMTENFPDEYRGKVFTPAPN